MVNPGALLPGLQFTAVVGPVRRSRHRAITAQSCANPPSPTHPASREYTTSTAALIAGVIG